MASRPGVRLDRISNLDVAPTIATLLGVELKNVTGHPLDKVLTNNLTAGHSINRSKMRASLT
jgi:hypothetical protein